MPHDITAAVGAAAFWFFVAVCVAAGAAQAISRNRETQKTIRQAIEKGQTLDPDTLERLLHGSREPKTPQSRFGLALGGLIMICIAIGFVLMGWFVTMSQGGGDFHVFLGVGCLIGMIGVPLLIASFFVGKRDGTRRD